MSHSHLALQHLLKKLENRGPRTSKGVRPDWITDLVAQAAELFEPFTDVGRVGFESRLIDDRWDVSMYLGNTELVGGKSDGAVRHVDFQFDILRLYGIFSQIESFHWNAIVAAQAEADVAPGEQCYLIVNGRFQDHPVRLRILCSPPEEAGPGLRHHPDGSWEPV